MTYGKLAYRNTLRSSLISQGYGEDLGFRILKEEK